MIHFKSLAVTVVLLGVLVFGAAVAHAGWYWNSATYVEGIEIRTPWTVTDDEFGFNDYFADIEIFLPPEVAASIFEVAKTEAASLASEHDVDIDDDDALSCHANGIEARVEFLLQGMAWRL